MEWPIRKERYLVRILTSEQTDIHIMDYSEDGILGIYVEDGLLADLSSIPEFVQATRRIPGYICLNRAGRKALRRMLNSIDRLERKRS